MVVAIAGAGVCSVVVVVGVVVSVICNMKYLLPIYYFYNNPGSVDKFDIPTCCSGR